MNRRSFLAYGGVAAAWGGQAGPGGAGQAPIPATRDELATPALIVDLDAFERNIAGMARFARENKRALRPHGKTHKCPEIARRLIRAGAVGCCAAKLSEAEAFGAGGVRGLLVTTAVIGKAKIQRAIRLATRQSDTIFCVDDPGNVQDLNDAAGAARIKLNVALDLLVGRRTGITPGEPAAELGKKVAALPNLKLAGLQAYAGHASHVVGFEERMKVSREAMLQAVETRRLLEKAGIPCPLVTGSSTGTYNIDSGIDGLTEMQPGSFIFMDVDYRKIGGRDGAEYRDFEQALTVLTTVVSRPAPKVAIVDGGFKAFATDRPFTPEARKADGSKYVFAGDEHGRLDLTAVERSVKVGDRIEFIIPHCDPTVNLYDRMYALRGDRVEAVGAVAGRGMSQ